MRKTNEQKRVEARLMLWEWAINHGWELLKIQNCLWGEDKRQKVRLNFRDQDVLRLERKVQTTDEERVEEPLKSSKWVCEKQGRYTAVRIAKGRLDFEGKRKGEGKVKNKEKSDG